MQRRDAVHVIWWHCYFSSITNSCKLGDSVAVISVQLSVGVRVVVLGFHSLIYCIAGASKEKSVHNHCFKFLFFTFTFCFVSLLLSCWKRRLRNWAVSVFPLASVGASGMRPCDLRPSCLEARSLLLELSSSRSHTSWIVVHCSWWINRRERSWRLCFNTMYSSQLL